eukprot:1144871-Pelagomonas_calceolata.AAC.2
MNKVFIVDSASHVDKNAMQGHLQVGSLKWKGGANAGQGNGREAPGKAGQRRLEGYRRGSRGPLARMTGKKKKRQRKPGPAMCIKENFSYLQAS